MEPEAPDARPFRGARRVARYGLYAVLAAAVLLVLVGAVVIGPYALRVRSFDPRPSEGWHATFHVYVSPGAAEAAARGQRVTLLVQPNNVGQPTDDVEATTDDAWWMGFGRHWLADDLGVVLVVPAFLRPGEDWQIYTHALDRDTLVTTRPDVARTDLQLLAMIDHAQETLAAEGIESEPRFLLQGFSASGMFANRFTVLHPSRVRAVASGSPGGWPIVPVAEWSDEPLPYPIGVSDLEALTGRPFDAQSYREVPQLIVMGSLDDNDSVDFRDGWDETAAAQVDRLFGADPASRWPRAQELYETVGSRAQFLMVEGVGHDRRALQQHSTIFFAEVLDGTRR